MLCFFPETVALCIEAQCVRFNANLLTSEVEPRPPAAGWIAKEATMDRSSARLETSRETTRERKGEDVGLFAPGRDVTSVDDGGAAVEVGKFHARLIGVARAVKVLRRRQRTTLLLKLAGERSFSPSSFRETSQPQILT
jgi:hypothetical protein